LNLTFDNCVGVVGGVWMWFFCTRTHTHTHTHTLTHEVLVESRGAHTHTHPRRGWRRRRASSRRRSRTSSRRMQALPSQRGRVESNKNLLKFSISFGDGRTKRRCQSRMLLMT